MIHIDPGPKDDKDIRLIQFRHRFGDLKCGNSHFFSSPVKLPAHAAGLHK
jgi:hypothetical protein